MITSLADAVLQSLNDGITPETNWILELMNSKDDLEKVAGEVINVDKLLEFQTICRPSQREYFQSICLSRYCVSIGHI